MHDDPHPCAVPDCNRPRHGRHRLCSVHEYNRLSGYSDDRKVSLRAKDPEQSLVYALERWLDSYEQRTDQLALLVNFVGQYYRMLEYKLKTLQSIDDEQSTHILQICHYVLARAIVDAEDDLAWERAQDTLRQALARYRKRSNTGSEP